MKIYHYDPLYFWDKIEQGSERSGGQPGLSPRPIFKDHDLGSKLDAVWAFLEPEPKEWKENTSFPHLWEDINSVVFGKLAIVLEIDVNPDSDPVYVMDWGHYEGWRSRKREAAQIPERYRHGDKQEAITAYMHSMVSMKEYLQNKDELNFSAPEVVYLGHVPLDRIMASETQPIIGEFLDNSRYSPESWQQSIERVARIPGMREGWLKRYLEERHAEGEILREGPGMGPEK